MGEKLQMFNQNRIFSPHKSDKNDVNECDYARILVVTLAVEVSNKMLLERTGNAGWHVVIDV